MFVSREDNGCTQLSKRGGGGAALAKTYTGIVMATYVKDKATNVKGQFQNAGDCAQQVIDMA